MDEAERAVAVARPLVSAALDDHAHRGQVVDLVELAALLRHLVVDRVEVLRAPRDLGGDVDLVELLLQHHRRLAHVLLAVGAALRDHLLDLLVLARMQRLEREVLELPLQGVDAEAMRERRVHLECLPRLLKLLLLTEVLDRAQVVQAVGELDQDDPQVFRHRDDQLAVVLRLRVLAALELDAGQLGHALDELCDLVPELGLHLVELDARVLDDVVEQRRGERRLVELEPGEDLRRRPTGGRRTPGRTGAPGRRGRARRNRRRGSAAPGRRRACTPRPRRATPRRGPDVAPGLPSTQCIPALLGDGTVRQLSCGEPVREGFTVRPVNPRSPC